MAAAEHFGEVKLLRRNSLDDSSRPDLAEQRVVLLGNNWRQRRLVVKLLVNRDVFISEPRWCQVVKYHTLTVINTPDLLQSDLTEDRLTELVREVAEASSPGPHVFLLVLEPESFTEQHQLRLQSILKKFSEKSFDHVIVLLFTDQQELFTQQMLLEKPHLKRFIEECRYSYQWIRHCEAEELNTFARAELVTRLTRIVKENSRKCLKYKEFKDPVHPSLCETLGTKPTEGTTRQSLTLEVKKLGCTERPWKKSPEDNKESEKSLRIVLIGKTGNGKSSSGNTILGRDAFKSDFGQNTTTKVCQKEHSIVNSCRAEVVDTPGLFDNSMSNQEINKEMIKCISLLAPGPHVFLLVLRIGRFTPEEKETLNLIITGFGKYAQKYIIVLFTHGDELDVYNTSFEDFIKDNDRCAVSCRKLISDCGNRYHVFNNRDKTKRQQQVNELIEKIDALVEENGGSCYTNEMLLEAEASIQEEMKRLMKEKEEELWNEMEEMKDKNQQEMYIIQQRMDRVRREKDKELREMEAKITCERELWKKEKEMRDKEEQMWLEEDRVKRQQYVQHLKELGENLQQSYDFKSKESRNITEQERKAWEEERKEWWEKRHMDEQKRQRDEQIKLEKLEQEYQDKLETLTKEKEDDRQRREQEERERKELEEKHEQQIEGLRKSFEERARRQAEELNEFKKRKDTDFADMIEEHLKEVQSLKEELDQSERKYHTLRNLAAHNETELKSDMVEIKTEMENLQSLHKHQLIDLAIAALMKERENCKTIKEIQKKHASEVEKCKKDIKHEYERERRKKTEALKTKQNQKMKDLMKNMNKEEKRDLCNVQKKQLEELQTDLWNQYKQQLKEELDEKKKQHEKELSKITDEFLRKNEKCLAKKMSALEKKQKAEMDKLIKKAKGKVNVVELDQLETEHQIEMDKIKKKVFRDKGKCPIL